MVGRRGQRFGVSGRLALLARHDAQALQVKQNPQLAHERVTDGISLAAVCAQRSDPPNAANGTLIEPAFSRIPFRSGVHCTAFTITQIVRIADDPSRSGRLSRCPPAAQVIPAQWQWRRLLGVRDRRAD